ncbi:MAG: hypothetical protein NVSMB17_03180 [Candidatus Dormibacteria bacterium]
MDSGRGDAQADGDLRGGEAVEIGQPHGGHGFDRQGAEGGSDLTPVQPSVKVLRGRSANRPTTQQRPAPNLIDEEAGSPPPGATAGQASAKDRGDSFLDDLFCLRDIIEDFQGEGVGDRAMKVKQPPGLGDRPTGVLR